MKKIYTLALLVLSLSFFGLNAVRAQATTPCSGGQPMDVENYSITLGGVQYCYVIVYNATPNSIVTLSNAGGAVANATADANGFVVVEYDCTKAPLVRVTSQLVTAPPLNVQVCYTEDVPAAFSLPIVLEKFVGKLNNGSVQIEWTTSLEINNEKFIIERSYDGEEFVAIGTVAGAGNSSSINNYSFVDNNFQLGSSAYYRLKQVDYDGKSTYSPVVIVSDNSVAAREIKAFPNPSFAKDQIQILGVPASEMKYENIKVYDVLGRNIRYTITGANALQLQTETPGTYIISINGKNVKIVKN